MVVIFDAIYMIHCSSNLNKMYIYFFNFHSLLPVGCHTFNISVMCFLSILNRKDMVCQEKKQTGKRQGNMLWREQIKSKTIQQPEFHNKWRKECVTGNKSKSGCCKKKYYSLMTVLRLRVFSQKSKIQICKSIHKLYAGLGINKSRGGQAK